MCFTKNGWSVFLTYDCIDEVHGAVVDPVTWLYRSLPQQLSVIDDLQVAASRQCPPDWPLGHSIIGISLHEVFP